MLEIVAEAGRHGGMFCIKCKKCGIETKNTWEKDFAIFQFVAECPTCGESSIFRLNTPMWSGRP